MSIKYEGFEQFQSKLNKLSNVKEFFDDAVFEVSIMTQNALMQKTPIDDLSGLEHTANLWQAPDKIIDAAYQIDNTKTSKDGKHSIAGILNYGRGPVFPKRAKRLYIPISRKAKNRDKEYGAPIPEDFTYGVDYVLAKKAGPYKGTGFITDVEKKSERLLVKYIGRKLQRTFK